MAENRLSWTDLRKALATRTGGSEREAKLFLEALNAQIIEGLKEDKQVKIKGIGTFRLQTVAPRKSVNVKTGEEILIEGYDKIVLVPEAGIKELIEHHTSMKKKNAKQPAEEVNPLKKLGEQADEIVDILADLGQGPKEKKEKKTSKAAKTAKTAKPKAKATKKAEPEVKEEKKAEPKVKETKKEEPKVVAKKTAVKKTAVKKTAAKKVVVEKEEPAVVVTPAAPVAPEKKEAAAPARTNHFLRDTLICVVILLMVLLAGYFFLRHQIGSWIDSLNDPKPVQTEQKATSITSEPAVENAASAKPFETIDETETVETVETVEPVQSDKPSKTGKSASASKEIVYTKFITTEEMHEASRLAWMAWRYYGNKDFWVYLYDANKDRIDNPDKIATGTPIRVPQLTAEQMDTTLESTRQVLRRLTEQGEAAKLR